MNDSPVDCQNHGVTEPQREGTALAVEGYKNVDNYYIFNNGTKVPTPHPSCFATHLPLRGEGLELC